MVTDLPGEVMSALQSSLSQFGVVVPNMPSGIIGPAAHRPRRALGGLTAPAATPGLTTPGLTAPGLTAPGLTAPTAAGLTDPALANPALTPGIAPGLPPTYPDQPGHPGPDHAAGRTDDPGTDAAGLTPAD